MTVFISHLTIDCHDAYALSTWWRQTLGFRDIPGDPNEPGHEECMIEHPESGQRLLFIEVPDEELPAKRIHLDVRPHERSRDEEVEWLIGRGAGFVADRRGIHGTGSGWVTLADPEGNQFCVLRSNSESASEA